MTPYKVVMMVKFQTSKLHQNCERFADWHIKSSSQNKKLQGWQKKKIMLIVKES